VTTGCWVGIGALVLVALLILLTGALNNRKPPKDGGLL